MTLDDLKLVALDGVHAKRWTTAHMRNVAQTLIDLADEIDFADEQLADLLAEARAS